MNITKGLWEKFERGDAFKLAEVRALIKQTEEALPYLHDRSRALGTLPTADAALTLHRLRGFEAALQEGEALKRPSASDDRKDLVERLAKSLHDKLPYVSPQALMGKLVEYLGEAFDAGSKR